MTPLHWAASYNAINTVKLLLDAGAHLEVKDDRGKTPLCRAATGNHIDIVRLLRDQGASLNVHDIHGWTPLHQAVFCSLPISEYLLGMGADPNSRDNRGNTSLHLMLRRTDYDNLRLLAGSDLQFYTRDHKLTSSCTQHITEFLTDRHILLSLLDHGLDPDLKNASGHTAMDLAALSGDFVFILWLIQAGAHVSLPVNSYPVGWPQTLLDDRTTCEVLLQYGRDRLNSLKELCKSSIRLGLYTPISASIAKLPLPTQLKIYLQIQIE